MFFKDSTTAGIYTLSLHDALPISAYRRSFAAHRRSFAAHRRSFAAYRRSFAAHRRSFARSEEHTSELQSRENLVCRLLLEKKKTKGMKNDECAACKLKHSRGRVFR